jgi:plastocyanin
MFLIVFALILAAATPVSSAKEVIVNMQNFAFIPTGQTLQANVTVDVGDTVTWVYADTLQGIPTGCALLNGPAPLPVCPGYSTTSVVAGQWDSKVFGKAVPPSAVQYPNNRYSVRFDAPGTFAYRCTVHETLQFPFNNLQGMKASVIVQGTAPVAPGAGPTPLSQPLPVTGSNAVSMSLMGVGLLYASWRLRKALVTADLESAW